MHNDKGRGKRRVRRGDADRERDNGAQRKDTHRDQVRNAQGACKKAERLQGKGGIAAPEGKPHRHALLADEFFEAVYD